MNPAGNGDGVRIGVYVCHCGGNISDVVDCGRVAASAARLPSVAVAREHSFMCSDPAQSVIIEDIRELGLNRLVVASCSPSLHETTFRAAAARAGLNPYLYQHVNIREQDSWVHGGQPEAATDKAIRLVGAAIGKTVLLEPQQRIEVPVRKRALVIGGGLSGLRAALSLSAWGVPVTLVEREAMLGGHAARLGPTFPDDREGREIVAELVAAVGREPGIEVLCDSEVTRMGGYLGQFDFAVRRLGEDGPPRQCGAVVVATGYRHYEPPTGELGFGVLPQVVTLPRFLTQLDSAADGGLILEGKPVRRVAFLHCVGSRQIEGVHEPAPGRELNRHCSRTCCTASVHAAARLRERFPDTRAFVFFRDMRTYGRHHEAVYERAARDRTVFFRYPDLDVPVVEPAEPGGEGPVRVRAVDLTCRGQTVSVDVDLVVLVTGMEPADPGAVVRDLKPALGSDRFLLEAHPKLRPVELAVQGVTVAGTAQAPMCMDECAAAAAAAAAKAAKILVRDTVSLEPYVARVDEARCDGCGVCVAECAYEGVLRIEPHPDGGPLRAVVNEALCKGCGACVAVCPPNAIDVVGCRLDQLLAYVDGLVAEAG